ncbi:Alpha/Beta hydrolase protein [Usnea florida]
MKRVFMFQPLLVESLSLCATAALTSQESGILPSLNNAISIGVMYISMTDKDRLDPFTDYTRQRQVMVSIYYPSQSDPSKALLEQKVEGEGQDYTNPYMPPLTAALYDELIAPLGFPNNTFEQLSTFCQEGATLQSGSMTSSLLIFSPGGGAPRFWYTTMLEDLARKNHIVVAVDHPYDALVVEFPDGRAVIGLNKTLSRDEVELLVTVRAQDMSFVIDELSRKFSAKLNTTDVIAFGHSLGGGTVAEATLNDTRIKGAINLDGRLFGSMEKPNVTLSKPLLQFASEATSLNPYWRWDEEWDRLAGWKLELVLDDAAHSTFSDLPLIAESFDLRGKLGWEREVLLGKVDGMRGLQVMVEYVSAFADFVLTEKNGTLLGSDGNERFPKVIIKRHV